MENACPCHPQPRGDWWQRGLAMIILLWQVPGINPRSCCSHLTAFRGRLWLGTGSRPRFSQQCSFRCKEKTAWKNKSLSEGKKKQIQSSFDTYSSERMTNREGWSLSPTSSNLNLNLPNKNFEADSEWRMGRPPPRPFLLRARLSKVMLVFFSRSLLKCTYIVP